MNLKSTAASLSEIERKTLSSLARSPKTLEQLSKESGTSIDSVRRSVNWLAEKGLASVEEKALKKFQLTKEGNRALDSGLPEKRMLEALSKKEKMGFGELARKAGLESNEFNIALGINKRNAFVIIAKEAEPMAELTEVGKAFLEKKSEGGKTLGEISEKGDSQNAEASREMIMRGLVEVKRETQRTASITGEGEKVKAMKEFSAERSYNVSDPVPELFIGKKQPYIQFLNIIRRKLTELGFREMCSPLIVHEFYNFDVLFQPQNHPARTWTDTYQLKNPSKGKLSDRKTVKAIKQAHETGGVSASAGWRYNWAEEIASKVMPAAHGTAHSARQLTKGVSSPGKYFAIARCFRPDVLDATHLIEFNQTEGFIVGDDLNFTHLLGVLEQFAKEIAGATEVKFIPDYYPFTEPSVQLSAKHPALGWVELGGAGMFRPEILENLGIRGQAIAWGIGVDRLAMFKLGIRDIRYLFSDNLDWLRKSGTVME